MADPFRRHPARDQTAADPSALGIADLEVVQGLARAVQHLHHESLRANERMALAHRIASSDFTAFLIIAGTLEATPKQLSRELRLTTSAVTALLDRLEEADLVVRAPHPSDRRSVVALLTDRGIAAKADVYSSYLRALAAGITAHPALGAPRTAELLHHVARAVALAEFGGAAPVRAG